jgi:hypothetical protein
VVGIGAVDAGVDTVVAVVATSSKDSPSASVTTAQSVGSTLSASIRVSGAPAAEVVPVAATPVVAAPAVSAPLAELLELQPANAKQTATATRRRIMRRG